MVFDIQSAVHQSLLESPILYETSPHLLHDLMKPMNSLTPYQLSLDEQRFVTYSERCETHSETKCSLSWHVPALTNDVISFSLSVQ